MVKMQNITRRIGANGRNAHLRVDWLHVPSYLLVPDPVDGPDVPVPLLPGGEALLRVAALHPPQPGALGGPPASSAAVSCG